MVDRALFRRTYLALAAVAAAALFAAVAWAAFAFLDPTPPRLVVMATGPESGISAELGGLYGELKRLEERGNEAWLPISFRPLLYTLKTHVALVRQRHAAALAAESRSRP
jgi:hypothetical protein